MWSHLRLTMLLARYRAEQPCFLPPYKGAMFRGALGHALQEVGCQRPGTPCEGCDQSADCAYGWLFEAGHARVAPDRFDRPVPYILLPPLDDRERFSPGDEIELRITLVGSARHWLPSVMWALSRIGEQGFGTGRSRWDLSGLWGVRPDGLQSLLNGGVFSGDSLAEWDGDELSGDCSAPHVTLRFVTPTLLEEKGQRGVELTATLIYKRLLRRMAGLAERYCGWSDAAFDFQSLLRAAEHIRCEDQQVLQVDWERFSTRQRRRIPLTGFVGRVTLRDVPVELRPWLAVGQWLHIGRRASFGMGAYRLIPADDERRVGGRRAAPASRGEGTR